MHHFLDTFLRMSRQPIIFSFRVSDQFRCVIDIAQFANQLCKEEQSKQTSCEMLDVLNHHRVRSFRPSTYLFVQNIIHGASGGEQAVRMKRG